MKALLFSALLALGLASSAHAAEQKDEIPADVRAYREALRLQEPAKKLAALEGFVRAYPKSRMRKTAESEILRTLVKVTPPDKNRITAQTKRLLKRTKRSERVLEYGSIASVLRECDACLPEAERFAREYLAFYDWNRYLTKQNKAAAASKQPAPKEADLRQRFNADRARAQDTLGQVCLKSGKAAEAEKLFREALEVNPALGGPAAGLGALAEKKGDSDTALEYYARARLFASSAKSRDKFEDAYRKNHSGSLDGAENYLDQQHRRLFPNPVHAQPYQATAKRTARVVLAEVYTGAGCPPCVAADLAFDVALERYARSELAVVMYHQHIPRPDPLANPDTRARYKIQAGRGVPTFVIDGKPTIGGGPREHTGDLEEKIRASIDARLEEPAAAQLSVTAHRKGTLVTVSARIEGLSGARPDLKLHLALVEKLVRYSGENGIRFHPMVVRSLTDFPIDSNDRHIDKSFDLRIVEDKLKQHLDNFEIGDERNPDGTLRFIEKKFQIDLHNLALVAFLQDEKTREVFQSVHVEVTE